MTRWSKSGKHCISDRSGCPSTIFEAFSLPKVKPSAFAYIADGELQVKFVERFGVLFLWLPFTSFTSAKKNALRVAWKETGIGRLERNYKEDGSQKTQIHGMAWLEYIWSIKRTVSISLRIVLEYLYQCMHTRRTKYSLYACNLYCRTRMMHYVLCVVCMVLDVLLQSTASPQHMSDDYMYCTVLYCT